MKVAFTHNLRLTDSEHEAEFDTAETVDAIAAAIEAAGHEVEKIEVSGPATNLLERLENVDPDIIFNTAEGSGGRMREAFYPALFDELGIPYTGSDAYTMALTLDKWLTKLVASRHGVDTPRAALVNAGNLDRIVERGLGLAFPVIVKPNYEGSSKGIADDSVVNDSKRLMTVLKAAVREYPDGVLVEEYIDGVDVAVGYVDGIGHDDGLLAPVEHLVETCGERPFNIYDYHLKNIEPGRVQFRCPAQIPRDVAARLRSVSLNVLEALGIRDLARLDYRIGEDGRFYLLEANALPALSQSSSIFAATSQLGLTYNATVAAVLNAAALRSNVATARELGLRRRRRRCTPIRVGFTYNIKREGVDVDNDDQAEWDPPETIIAIANALARQGHIVVHLEATPDLPRVLAEADVDLIFNIAEGVEGRNREAQVPALCELLGIPYTGSDSATLAIALDKALCKKVLMQHNILTPKFQVMETGRERLSSDLSFPLIVKPNAEGSSKGIANANVVDDLEELRAAVRSILDRYRQPVIIEEYVSGREFTVGLLGDKRPRILPPMEIRFKDESIQRPVYDFVVKQEWEQHVYYECPAKLTPTERKNIEKVARDTFWALDCRDVGRVDLRMDNSGRIYVLEVNPLPGLTPNYSDLVLISQAAGMDYDQLMAEIMIGGLRRLREKRRREEQASREEQAADERRDSDSGNGRSKGAPAPRRLHTRSNANAAGANASNGDASNGRGSDANGSNGRASDEAVLARLASKRDPDRPSKRTRQGNTTALTTNTPVEPISQTRH
ncbi:MAG: ATP-grasp domain-containing protein [Proteobacteria bacterium]|nr:ATP-grasp domain-containing protein [Pseudomonadota bacterium]